MGFWGDLATVGASGVAGYLGSESEKSAAKGRKRSITKEYRRAAEINRVGSVRRQALLTQRLATEQNAFGQAKRRLAGVSAGAQRAAYDQSKANTGGLISGLNQRGLGSTSLAKTASNGQTAALARALAEIDAGIGSRLGELDVEQGLSQGSILSQLGGAAHEDAGDQIQLLMAKLAQLYGDQNSGQTGGQAGGLDIGAIISLLSAGA